MPPTDTPTPTPETTGAAPAGRRRRGLSRRGFLGRGGVATAGVAAVAGPAIAAEAAAAAAPQARVGAVAAPRAPRATRAEALPDPDAVLAQEKPLVDRDIVELASLLQAGRTTSLELTQAYLDRIDRFNGPLETYGINGGYNAFVRIARDEALAMARLADQRLSAARAGGPAAPYLCGIPMGIKDSVGIEGRPSKNGTQSFSANLALGDATIVARLRDQGVVLLGHTICSAYSGAIAGNFAANAWDGASIPGGSSQGSGCAPIARLAAATIGEETGGSIVWPAAINGASAIKPSLGLAPISGVMPLSAAYDVVGPLARSGRDAALIMNAILGPDPDGDPQTLAAPNPFPVFSIAPRATSRPLAGLTIGIPQTDWMTRGSTVVKQSPQALYDADHKAAFDRVRRELGAMGATVKEFRGLDITEYGAAPDHLGENPYYLNPAVLERVDGTDVTPRVAVVGANRSEIRYVEAVQQFAESQGGAVETALEAQYGRRPGGATSGPATFEGSIALNDGISNAARREGERRRRLLITQYQEALDRDGIDVMLVMSIGAEVGLRDPGNSGAGLPLRRYNQIANDLSWPMVSFPVGSTSGKGLPISVQLWGPRFSEPGLVQAMIDYQAKHPEHHTRFPADPATAAPRSLSSTLRRRADPEPTEDPALTNDPLVEELAAVARRR